MSGARKSVCETPASQTSSPREPAPPLGCSPPGSPGYCVSHAFTYMGIGYSALPAAATASTYWEYCQASKISSALCEEPKTSAQVPLFLKPASLQSSSNSGCSDCLFFMRKSSRSSGTGLFQAASASGEKSRGEPRTPDSFSTCIISTVCLLPSTSRMCFIKAAKACASASRSALLLAERISRLPPCRSCARGNRFWSDLTHAGPYPDSPFFQLPNHKKTR